MGDNINRGVYGINTSFSYKNFDLSVLMQGQWGANVYDLANQLGQLGVNGINTFKKFYDGRYISEAEPGNGKVPRAGFYEKFGYVRRGEEYPDEGQPHIYMEKTLVR